jgi:hypothetical protein
MAGNSFSGHFGRRSTRPYLEEIPRVYAVQATGLNLSHKPRGVFIPFNGMMHRVAVMQVRVGAMNQCRFICKQCGNRCRILYLGTSAVCRDCNGSRYRTQIESTATRFRHRAYKFLETANLDLIHPENKIPNRHRNTHLRVLEAAERAIEIIMEHNERITSLLRAIE